MELRLCWVIAATVLSINADEIHISPANLMEHTRALSSDAFEGRGPGTAGEERSVAYITEAFKKIGLKPGNPDGSYVQQVPLVGITGHPENSFTAGGKNVKLQAPADIVLWSPHAKTETQVADSEVVFVGYGAVAPEYDWDDFKGVDLHGKTILMLVNDPAIPDKNDPSKLDASMFKGAEMTYYGRWTYKFEIAAKMGASAALVIHETKPAAYPFEVVINSNARERFELKGNGNRIPVEGWISYQGATQLCSAGGKDLEEMKRLALRKDFKPIPLNARATFHVRNDVREINSRNVLALLPGQNADSREMLIYTAHWDHLGMNPALSGDQIYNGALDNASGVAGLLELARVFAAQPRAQHSILFLAVTAEEKGLLGSKYYATHPLYPLKSTLANINMDGINPWGRTRDLEIIGIGKTSIEDRIGALLKEQGRVAVPDSEPEKGHYYRSDHFEFAKLGVPAAYTETGVDFIDKPDGFGKMKHDAYTASDYHKVSDEVKADWDFSGGAEDVEVLYRVGNEIANGKFRPEWKTGAEFHR